MRGRGQSAEGLFRADGCTRRVREIWPWLEIPTPSAPFGVPSEGSGPCPKCDGPQSWEAVSGGDSADDPYPDQN